MKFSIYALFGPPLGALVFWFLSFVPPTLKSMIRDLSWHEGAWTRSIHLLAVFVAGSYLLGGIAAIGTGICHTVVAKRTQSTRARIVAVVLVGVSLQAMLLFLSNNSGSIFENLEPALAMIVAAGMASFLLAVFVEFMYSKRTEVR